MPMSIASRRSLSYGYSQLFLDVLVAEAVSIGLDESECRAVLADERYAEEVRDEERFWLSRGVRSVPTFVFDNKYAVAGAHEPASLADMIRNAATGEN